MQHFPIQITWIKLANESITTVGIGWLMDPPSFHARSTMNWMIVCFSL